MTEKKTTKSGNPHFLIPQQEPTHIDGKVFYNESDQSWSIIKLKRDVLKKFPQLKEKQAHINYKMIIHRTHEDAKKAIINIKEGMIPILLFFEKVALD